MFLIILLTGGIIKVSAKDNGDLNMFGECHAHVIMDGINYREAVALHKNGVVEEVIHSCFLKYKEAGIIFIRDGGDSFGVSKRAKELAPEYGITYLTPVFAIHKSGHYGGIVGREFRDLREYHKMVNEAKQSGADFIKLWSVDSLILADMEF